MEIVRMTDRQARGFLGCSEHKLKRLRLNREIKYYRLGHRTISYDRASLQTYLDRNTVEAVNS
jgi:hypothetical protein